MKMQVEEMLIITASKSIRKDLKKVRLSPREMDLINSSGPSGEYNDLVEIMNEYNELIDYLASPRANKQTAASSFKTNGTASLHSNKTKTKSNNHASAAMPMKKNVPHYSQQRHDEEEGDYYRNDDGEDAYDQEDDDDEYDDNDPYANVRSLLLMLPTFRMMPITMMMTIIH